MHMRPTNSPTATARLASLEAATDLELSKTLRALPAQLGFTDVSELIAALEQTFGLNGVHAPSATARPAPAARPKTRAADEFLAVETPSPETTIRAVLNRRLGSVNGFTPEQKIRQQNEREEMLHSLLALFQIGLRRAGNGTPPVVREFDVERVLATLRRLALVRKARPQDVAAYCLAEADADVQAHRLDPFQLRHVLAFHDDVPHEELPYLEICCLRAACQHRDDAAIREWFDGAFAKADLLPRGTTSFLKRLILEQWQEGNRELDVLVTEQAALDVRMFGDLGWENSRLFYAQLARITGGVKSPFVSYMNEEEIEDAVLQSSRMAGGTEMQVRFAALHGTQAQQSLAQIEKRVFDAAKNRGNGPVATASSALRRPQGLATTPELSGLLGARLRTI